MVRPVRAPILLGLAFAVYAAQCWLYAHYTNDDAYITFRYSRFLALGRGPYFNPGEHVEGYTNLLLMLMLAPAIALGGPGAAPLAAKAIGAASGAVALAFAFFLVRALSMAAGAPRARAEVLGLAATALVAVAPAYALNAMSGLETTLFSALVTCGVTLLAQRGGIAFEPVHSTAVRLILAGGDTGRSKARGAHRSRPSER